MKKLVIIFALFLLIASFAQAQTTGSDRVNYLKYGLLTAYTTETQYLELKGWTKIDSISTFVLCKGGTGNLCEVDSIVFYVGGKTENGYGFSATPYTQLVTVNPAAGVVEYERLLTTNATKLTSAVLRGCNVIKCVVYPSDETSVAPSFFDVGFQIWGTK